MNPTPAATDVESRNIVKMVRAVIKRRPLEDNSDLYTVIKALSALTTPNVHPQCDGVCGAIIHEGCPLHDVAPQRGKLSDVPVAADLEPATDEELKWIKATIMSMLLDINEQKSQAAFVFNKVMKRLTIAESHIPTKSPVEKEKSLGQLIQELHERCVKEGIIHTNGICSAGKNIDE